MLYLDNAATTKPNEQVLSTLDQLYHDYFLNANSPYLDAIKINKLQESARHKLAEMLNVNHRDIIYTASGSEGNNMLIKGIAFKYLNKDKKHIITSSIEHSSVYETMKQLEGFGFEITYLMPQADGSINNKDILNAIKDNTILISIMKVNSELGSINHLDEIYDEIKLINSQIIVHMDCVQALGKVNLNLAKMDCASFSAHKINGVKGSGFIYQNKLSLVPLISGGEQENGYRAGTSNYYFNILLVKTLRLYLESKNNPKERFEYIYDLLAQDKRIHLNTPIDNCSYYILNFSLPDYKIETILNALENKEILTSTKSACSSNVKVSRVMKNLPIKEEYKNSALRISFDNQTSKEDLTYFYEQLKIILDNVRRDHQ